MKAGGELLQALDSEQTLHRQEEQALRAELETTLAILYTTTNERNAAALELEAERNAYDEAAGMMQTERAWMRRALVAIEAIHSVDEWSGPGWITAELIADAPASIKGEKS